MIDDAFQEVLIEIFTSNKALFPEKSKTLDDVKSSYQIYQSLRRTSDTCAYEVKVSPTDIDIVNRWEKVEGAKG